MSEFIIRQAEESDIPHIVDIGPKFFAESNFTDNNDYDPEQTAYVFGYMIASEEHVVLVAYNPEGILTGFIAFDVMRFYTKKPIAHLFLFYVAPEFRKLAIGRHLLKNALEIAKNKGAVRFYAASTAGIDDGGKINKTLLNLYKRYGFTELGCFVQRELHNVESI